MAVANTLVVLMALSMHAEAKFPGKIAGKLAGALGGDPLAKAEAILTVADKAVDLVSKVNAIVTKKLDAHYQSVAQRPEDIVKGSATAAIKKGLGKGKRVTFEKLRGFKGIEEFEPSGWVYSESSVGTARQPDAEMQNANAYPMGAGYMMMSGCFGSNYQKGDPCYKALRFVSRCANQIDSANFIGVGFDITKSYSAESRKKSVIQRVCQNKAGFMGQDIPDNMNAYGIYDYSIGTRSFQSAYQYRQYLATKAGTEMSAGVFKQVSAEFQRTESVASSGLFYDVGTARSSGWGSTAKSGVKLTSSLRSQMSKQGAGSSHSFLAVLEADLKLYEIALDHSTPEDLSAPFLNDFMRLPTSYYLIGADIKLQDFILRYGTHYVKTAKFGGKLNIFKSSRRDSKMSEDQFAASAEMEFSAMMSTLHSSFSQSQTKVNFFGTGGQSGTKSRSGSAKEINKSKNSKTSTESGKQTNARSEFIETTVDAMGGNPEIAAAIMDFYSPAFKGLFIKWLSTIRDYPKPYDMTFGKIPELLDVNVDSLFKVGKAGSGCFAKNLKKDANGEYFIQNHTMNDGQNRTIITLQKKYCKYGKDKTKFMNDFKARRLALEKAVTIYIAEGQFSVSSFDLPPGNKGCETETIRYLSGGLTQSHTWPKWNDMEKVTFKVLFQLPFDLPMLKRDVEFEVKYNDGLWYTAIPGEAFTVDNSCPSAPGLPSKNRVCVVGMNLVYNQKHGYFTFDKDYYKREATYAANITKLVGNRFVARAEFRNILKQLTKNKIGEVPCNVKWSNAHRIDPQQTTSCIHFSAASKGDIFVIFSSIPKDYSTWFYLQMSPSGIAFYRAMKLEKIDNVRSSGTLGEEVLFETFFVCITQKKGKDLKILYGKAPAQREVGTVHAAFTYPLSDRDTVSFYTFGAGEEKISVDDVRVIQDKPKMSCGEGYIEVEGSCDLICHRECNGCHQARDRRSCIACKNTKHFYANGKFECLSKCPPGYELIGAVCSICKAGHYKASPGNSKCKQCNAGSYQNSEGKLKCKPCSKGHYQKDTGKKSCAKCAKGYYQGSGGQRQCLKCGKGFYQHKEGQKACSDCGEGHRCPRRGLAQQLKCPANTYNGKTRQTKCTPCANGESSKAGSASCGNACNVGSYLRVKVGCRPCPSGEVAAVRGMASCRRCPVGEIPNKKRSKCQDKNECAIRKGGCAHVCVNTHGSYKCTCNRGFLLNSNGRTCRDNNECSRFLGGCSQICTNTIGSYTCSCRRGFLQGGDKKSCKDINECAGAKCHKCVNTPGSYKCSCYSGYYLKGRNVCRDVNECAAKNGGCAQNCHNTVGGYRCSCNIGYKLHSNKKSCTPIGLSCSTRSTNLNSQGAGQSNYLDRHHVSCPNNGFISMFNLRRGPKLEKIKYTYNCCSNPVTRLCTMQQKSTSQNDAGGGNTVYLDRHSVDCGYGNIITSFQLHTDKSGKIYYRYSCCNLSSKQLGSRRCNTGDTGLTTNGGGNVLYLDRQKVQCPSDRALSYFQLTRDVSGGKMRYHYRCCQVVA